MKKFVLMGWLFVCVCQAGQDIYSAHERKAYKKALGLVALYYGIDHQLTTFNPIPGGGFELEITDSHSDQTRSLFLLADLEHLIEGKLLSPLDLNAQHHQIKPLKKLAEHNLQVNQQLSEFKQQLSPNYASKLASELLTDTSQAVQSTPLTGKTAAHYLKAPFTAQSEPAPSDFLRYGSGLSEHYATLSSLNHFSWGNGNKDLYVFVDLNCPACRQAHRAIEKNIDKEQVTIHYIPVGILGQDSEAKASLVLAPNENDARNEAFHYLFQKAKASELVDISVDQSLINQGWQRYKENTLAFLNLPRPVTPTFAVMSEQGPVIRAAVSTAQIQSMIDLAVANGDDPDLPASAGN